MIKAYYLFTVGKEIERIVLNDIGMKLIDDILTYSPHWINCIARSETFLVSVVIRRSKSLIYPKFRRFPAYRFAEFAFYSYLCILPKVSQDLNSISH